MNGMMWQMGKLERVFRGDAFESNPPPRIFNEMVELYNSDRTQYEAIVKEAHALINSVKCLSKEERRTEFEKWLIKNGYSAVDEIILCIDAVSNYAVKCYVASESFYEISDAEAFDKIRNKLSTYRNFTLLHRKRNAQFIKYGALYAKFLKEQQTAPISSEEKIDSRETIEEEAAVDRSSPQIQPIDFNDIGSLVFTKPISLSFRGKIISAFNSWKECYVTACREIFATDMESAMSFMGASLVGGKRPDFARAELAVNMTSPMRVTDDIVAETNLNANDLVKRIKILLDFYKISYDDIEIKYSAKAEIDKQLSRSVVDGGVDDAGIIEKNHVPEESAVPTSGNTHETQRDINQELKEAQEELTLAQYVLWLLQDKKLADGTSRSYASNLRLVSMRKSV